MKRYFSEGDIQTDVTLLSIANHWEMQFKTTVIYFLIVRISFTKRIKDNVEEEREEEISVHHWRMWVHNIRDKLFFLDSSKHWNYNCYINSISLNMFIRSKTTCILVASLFTIASIKTQPKQLSVDERIKKMHCVQMCTTEYYLALKKERYWDSMDESRGHYDQCNESHRCCIISLVCGIENMLISQKRIEWQLPETVGRKSKDLRNY